MTDLPAASFALTVDAATWLVSADGLAVLDTATRAFDQGEDELAIATRLRSHGLDVERARAVLDAAQARRRARERYADADALVLTTSALEQASHPLAAELRAARYRDAPHVTDLCSGVGGDTLALAGTAADVTAVDLDAARLVLLRHNAGVRGLRIHTVEADVLTHRVSAGTLVHADPGRRYAGRRLRRLGEYRPPVPALLAHVADADGAGIVVSPAVDLTDPGLPSAAELEFVQHGHQLLEASIWTGSLRRDGTVARATLVPSGESVARDGAPVSLAVGDVKSLLLEPVAAVVRARLHGQLGAEAGAHRLAHRRALLTGDTVPVSPWFHVWEVEDVLPLRPKAVKRRLRELDDAPIEIATHGVDAAPDEWWRRLGRPDRGPQGRRLHLVRTDDGALCVITRPRAPERSP